MGQSLSLPGQWERKPSVALRRVTKTTGGLDPVLLEGSLLAYACGSAPRRGSRNPAAAVDRRDARLPPRAAFVLDTLRVRRRRRVFPGHGLGTRKSAGRTGDDESKVGPTAGTRRLLRLALPAGKHAEAWPENTSQKGSCLSLGVSMCSCSLGDAATRAGGDASYAEWIHYTDDVPILLLF